MTFRTLMTSSAVLAIMAGGAMAQDASQSADPGAVPEISAPTETVPAFTSLEEMTVGDVIGTPVITAADENAGEIDYVIMMGDGTPAAVIGIGGFLGLGEYTVALPLSNFTYDPEQYALVVGQTKEQLEATPEIDESGLESLPDETPIAGLIAQAEPPLDENATADIGVAADTGASTEVAPTGEQATSETDMAAGSGAATEAAPADSGETDMAADTDMATGNAADEEVAQATGADENAGIAEPVPGQEVSVTAAPKSLEKMSVADAIGTRVQTDSGTDVGEVEYIVLQSDKSLDAVVGIGGFLGVGEHDVALPLDRFTYDEEQKILQVSMTEEELRQLPEYDEVSVEGAQKLSKDTIIGEAAAN